MRRLFPEDFIVYSLSTTRTRRKYTLKYHSLLLLVLLYQFSSGEFLLGLDARVSYFCMSKARFKRHLLHVPNLMQMSENNRFVSFALDSAHVKCDVYNGP